MNIERNIEFFKILDNKELDELHFSSLELLERTGINIHHEEAIKLLNQAGAKVNGKRVKIPSSLVKQALNTVPERVVVSNRTGERKIFLEKGKTYFGTGSDLKYTIDIYNQKKKNTVLEDIKNAALLCDYLENIDFIMSYGLASNVKANTGELHQFYAMIQNNCSKPMIITSFEMDFEVLKALYEIACIVAGGETELRNNPFIVLYGQFISPFEHNKDGLERLLFCAEKGIPIIYVPTVMAGASGPATMAGSLALANAETLTGIVISQLKSKGAPFIFGGCVTPFDMREAVIPYGAPEWSINDVVLAQLARYYNLPVFGTGGCSDSPIVDEQAAIEGTFSVLLGALAGTNLIHDVGYLERGLTGDLSYLVMMDEVIGMTKRVLQGIEVNNSTLVLDLINKVGPGGHFTEKKHTYDNFKKETWYPDLIKRKGQDKSMKFRAREKAKKILENNEAKPVSNLKNKEIKNIINSIEDKN